MLYDVARSESHRHRIIEHDAVEGLAAQRSHERGIEQKRRRDGRGALVARIHGCGRQQAAEQASGGLPGRAAGSLRPLHPCMQRCACAGAATVSCVDHTQQRRRGPDGRNSDQLRARCERAQLLRCRQLHSPRSAGVDTRGPYSYPASSRGQRTACSLPTRRRPGTGTTPARPARARRRECLTCTTGPLPSAAPWVPVPWVIGPTVAAAWRARERQGPRAAVRHTCSGRSRSLRESARCRTPGSAGGAQASGQTRIDQVMRAGFGVDHATNVRCRAVTCIEHDGRIVRRAAQHGAAVRRCRTGVRPDHRSGRRTSIRPSASTLAVRCTIWVVAGGAVHPSSSCNHSCRK